MFSHNEIIAVDIISTVNIIVVITCVDLLSVSLTNDVNGLLMGFF